MFSNIRSVVRVRGCLASTENRLCRVRVISRHFTNARQCLLYPRKQTWFSTIVMFALCHKRHNDLVGEQLHLIGNGQSERSNGLEIDYKVELCRLLDRQISRLCTFQNLLGVRPPFAVPHRGSINCR
jgi:hypothetical protein